MIAMRLDELVAERPRTLSFEFFPPKPGPAEAQFERTVAELAELAPDFMTVTYGAGGGSRDRTRDAVAHILATTDLPAVAHFTCVGHTRGEIAAVMDDFHAVGIRNLLALRGDPPKGEDRFTPVPGGCRYASELIELIAADGRFASACAAFPEGHPDAATREQDWSHLLGKFDAGACMAMTQCFFSAPPFREMQAWLAERRDPPPRIVPGIMPVRSWPWVQDFVARFAPTASLPDALRERLEPLADDPERSAEVGLAYTIEQCRELLRGGAPGLHIYTLNKADRVRRIVEALRVDDLL